MASVIEAIIFDNIDAAGVPASLEVVRLTPHLSMLRVTDEMLAGLDPSAGGDEGIPPDWTLRQPVAALARSLSAGRRALYLYSETFGGPGTTEAIAWADGNILYGPAGTCDVEPDRRPAYQVAGGRDSAVNAGLRAIGVVASEGQDEYGTVGLDQHDRKSG